MKTLPLPEFETLHALFSYSQDTGLVTSRVDRPRCPEGSQVGSLKNGYLRVSIGYQLFQLHRVVWKMVTGEDPGDDEIDHVNSNRNDNRWNNLRRCVRSGNQQNKNRQSNNTSGIKGVSWDKRYGKWRAVLKERGQQIHIGYFSNKVEAGNAVVARRKTLHKEFTNHG